MQIPQTPIGKLQEHIAILKTVYKPIERKINKV